jgi:hypothetical protein
MGLERIGEIFGFLGIASSTGSNKKWKAIQDTIGRAQEAVCGQVLEEENIAEEILVSKELAAKEYSDWEKSPEGLAATVEGKAKLFF